MIVTAKPSSDPNQEKLRETKRIWNKEVKQFIDDLINFKKNVNGQPSKFVKEKSNIKDPLPGNPSSVMSALVTKFKKLNQNANTIIQQQLYYSKTRKKKQVSP